MLAAVADPSKAEQGASSVELALLMPFLMLVLLGTVDLGRSMYAALCVTNAATAGAQYGAQNNGKTSDYAGMNAAAMSAGRDLGSALVTTARRYCECPGNVSVNCLTGTCNSGYGAPQVYVAVDASTTFQTLFRYPGIPASISVRLCRGLGP